MKTPRTLILAALFAVALAAQASPELAPVTPTVAAQELPADPHEDPVGTFLLWAILSNLGYLLLI